MDYGQLVRDAASGCASKCKNKDVKAYLQVAVVLLGQQVCPRCVLRTFGYGQFQQYASPAPSSEDLATSLMAQLSAGSPKAAAAPAPANGAAQPIASQLSGPKQQQGANAHQETCTTAVAAAAAGTEVAPQQQPEAEHGAGLVSGSKRPLEAGPGAPPSTTTSPGAAEGSAQPCPQHPPATAPAAGQAEQQGAEPPAKRPCLQGANEPEPSGSCAPAPAPAPGPASGPAPAPASSPAGAAAACSAAARRAVCPLCLGAMQLLDGPLAAPLPAAAAGASADVAGAAAGVDATALSASEAKGAPLRTSASQASTAEGHALGAQPLTHLDPVLLAEVVQSQLAGVAPGSFGIEVWLPLNLAIRDHAMAGQLAHRWGSRGMFGQWTAGSITPARNIIRRVLAAPLAQALSQAPGKAPGSSNNSQEQQEGQDQAQQQQSGDQQALSQAPGKAPGSSNNSQEQQEGQDQAQQQQSGDQQAPVAGQQQQPQQRAAGVSSGPGPAASSGSGRWVFTESSQADVVVQLTLQHPESCRRELRALLEDQMRMKQRREQGGRGRGRQQGGNKGRGAGRGQGRGQEGETLDPAYQVNEQMISDLTPERVAQQLSYIPPHVLAKLFPWPPAPTSTPSRLLAKATRATLLLAGRYLKLKRGMPQTLWTNPATGERIGGVSLAERIEEVLLPAYGASASKFISGGREDADVRCLGEGRPFVLELLGPTRGHPGEAGLRALEERLREAGNGAQVVGLRPCSRAAIEAIKEAEESKEKTYEALCWAARPLGEGDVAKLMALGAEGVQLQQDTPVRVLHRRATKVRPKMVWIEHVAPFPSKPSYFKLKIRGQAGTYIKEFCHGDWGRTQPSLGSLLGCMVEILQLDVLAVHMGDWP